MPFLNVDALDMELRRRGDSVGAYIGTTLHLLNNIALSVLL